jgi:hypothetical protein
MRSFRVWLDVSVAQSAFPTYSRAIARQDEANLAVALSVRVPVLAKRNFFGGNYDDATTFNNLHSHDRLRAAFVGSAHHCHTPCLQLHPIDFPNATQTIAYGISPGGDIVGTYTDSVNHLQHGFLLSGGNFNSFDVQIDGVTVTGTQARGINPAGEIVGTYTIPTSEVPSPANIKGFLLSHGTFSTALFPGHPGAIPQRITPDGDI